jgi:phytoene desaturase
MQLGPLRPKSTSEDVEGLHWVGGGTHPGSGLVTIFESARIAADRIAAQHGRTVKVPAAPPVPDEIARWGRGAA